jgi:Nif-specific regulatory protein
MASEKTKVKKRKADANRHLKELETLYKVGQILSSSTPQKQVLTEVLDTLDHDLGMSRGVITLIAPDGKDILIEVARGFSEKKRRTVRYQIGEGITGNVIQSGKAMVVPKVSLEPMFLDRFDRKKITDKEISFICVPISIGQETIGAISTDLAFDKTTSLDEYKRFLSIVANMIANDVKARQEVAIQKRLLEDENVRLHHELEDRFRPENIIGNSNAMRDVYRQIHQVSTSDTTVLIRGESGTGKELVAHAIHYSSPRAKGAFTKVNCAALNENLLESELFGHEKGAFTGATQTRKGRIEEADGGTLFLDEIGDFSPAMQVKLLRFLQEREFERVGSSRTLKSNARIIAATNRDLEQAVEKQGFRRDLYYRINVFPIFLPPLRDRKDDILLLADYFVEQYSQKMKKNIRRITTPVINMMVAYHWPGNVRELENCIERAVLLSTDEVIHGHHLPPTLQTSDASGTTGKGSLKDRVELFERDVIVDAIKRCNGNIAATARDLGTTPRIIRYKLEYLSIDSQQYKIKRTQEK